MKSTIATFLLLLPLTSMADAASVKASMKPPSEFLNDVAEVGIGISEQYQIPIGRLIESGVSMIESSPKYLGLAEGDVDAVPGKVSGLINRMARGDLPRGRRPQKDLSAPGSVPFLDGLDLSSELSLPVKQADPNQPIVVLPE